METIEAAYRRSLNLLASIYPEGEALAIINRLFEDKFGIDKHLLRTGFARDFDMSKDLDFSLERLSKYEPLQHITGFEYFGGLKIRVNKNVLIPRPETEELLHWVFSDTDAEPHTIADICTGSGCIAMALRQRFGHSQIYGTDISDLALNLASSSEKDNFKDNSIIWVRHNILGEDWEWPSPEIVVSNPPYILADEKTNMDNNVVNYEPHIALFVNDPDPLLFYKKIISLFSGRGLTTVYFELNPLTAKSLLEYCLDKKLTIETRFDMFGKERFAKITG